MISKNQVRKAGKRIASGDYSSEDIRIVEEYRATFDSLLIASSDDVNKVLSQLGVSFLVSGRPKRTNSIRRKLLRERAHGMNLANMADLVGLRVIVSDVFAQNMTIEALVSQLGSRVSVRDYRNRETGYRAVHLIRHVDSKALEIQIRTLPQHIWAVESESFNETVKEGGGPPDVRRYLDSQLTAVCKAIDEDRSVDIQFETLFRERAPISRFLENMRVLFRLATEGFARPRTDTTYIVVFDSVLRVLTRVSPFKNGREEAIREYNRLCGNVDQERFGVVVLNSRTREAISVTHPNFFPRVQFGVFE